MRSCVAHILEQAVKVETSSRSRYTSQSKPEQLKKNYVEVARTGPFLLVVGHKNSLRHRTHITHLIMSDSEEEVAVAAVEAPKAKGKGKRGKVSLTKIWHKLFMVFTARCCH
jgi:hypothetical protein